MMCILLHFYTATMPIAMPPGTTGRSSSCSSVSPSAKISRSSAWTEWRNFLQLGLHWQFTKKFGEALSALLKGAKVFQALLWFFVFSNKCSVDSVHCSFHRALKACFCGAAWLEMASWWFRTHNWYPWDSIGKLLGFPRALQRWICFRAQNETWIPIADSLWFIALPPPPRLPPLHQGPRLHQHWQP